MIGLNAGTVNLLPRWRVELLGGLRVRGAGRLLEKFRTQKTGALLAYLAYFTDRPHSRETLTEVLWPEDEIEQARHKLSVALSSLRQQLEPAGVPDSSVIIADRLSIRLNPDAVSTDVVEFENAIHRLEPAKDHKDRVVRLRNALEAYGGPLLPGFYEDWVLPQQRRLENFYMEAVRKLVPLLEEEGDHAAALEVALKATALDPLREECHRLVIRLHYARGHRDAALRQYADMERTLRRELSASPSPESVRLAREISEQAIASEIESTSTAIRWQPASEPHSSLPEDMDPVGGAVPLDSPFYVSREADGEILRTISRRASVVLIKGPGQVGKTSLLARALHAARSSGARAAYTPLHIFNAEQLQSASSFLQAVIRSMCEQFECQAPLKELWMAEDGPNINFRRFMRWLISQDPGSAVVWALDDVDRLFSYAFGTEIFALMRAWHNERALDPGGPWSKLTLIIAYATEAHLFIRDVNQSPFNVGLRITVDDLSLDQLADTNRRYGSPLREAVELRGFHRLVGGHPFLVRRGLLEMAERKMRYPALEAMADRDEWVYGEHLRRIRALIAHDVGLSASVEGVLLRRKMPDAESFYRLRSAGVLRGANCEEAELRCALYERYLSRYLSRS